MTLGTLTPIPPYGQDYVDKGVEAYEDQFKEKRIQTMMNSAKQMGYEMKPIEIVA